MDKNKHLQPKDYDQIIANCMVEPDYNIAEYLEGQFSEHSQSNANFMQGLEDAFDREESKSKYNNIKIVIAANKGQVSDPRIDKLKIIATWGEIKKQNIDLERTRQLLKRCKQGIYRIEKGLHELENAPDFKSLFVIDPTPCQIKEGEAFTSVYGIEKQHRFNINNLQILTEPGVIREAYFRNYVNLLSILLSERLKASEIPDFLNYHYKNAIDKLGLINFISFDLWDYISESGINTHRKEIIMQWAANISQQQDISTQRGGLQCIDNIKTEDLIFIFSRLKGMLHKSVIESDFVATFQAGALPIGWKRIIWTGSNPELATLINQLTGLRPIPSIVKPLFQTKKEYENVNSSRTANLPIIELVTAALK